MADDRQLRDDLEKVQSEVSRLKKALDAPQGLHADVRARIEALRKSRGQQQSKLDDVTAEAAKLEEQLRGIMQENDVLQRELDALLTTERMLVDTAVRSLDPGPSVRAGCGTAVVVVFAALALGACW